MKKILCVSLVFAVLLSFAACGSEVNKTGPVEISRNDSFVIRQDNITVDEIRLDDGDYYIAVSGLKDEAVQNKINKEIKDVFFRLHDDYSVPKYRGIEADAEKWTDIGPTSRYCYAGENSKVGNVLSVYVSCSTFYDSDDGSGSFSYRILEPLNFDLNTGEHIKLSDIFYDPDEGMNFVNDKIRTKINDSDQLSDGSCDGYGVSEYICLADEFPGVDDDQKFYISFAGDMIYLVFDQDTQWISLNGYAPEEVLVNVKPVSALQDKFVKENIYLDDSVNYMLMSNSYDADSEIDGGDSSESYRGDEGLNYSWQYFYYDGMPENQIAYIESYPDEMSDEIDSFIENFAAKKLSSSAIYNASLALSADLFRYGKYTTISRSFYGVTYRADEWIYDPAVDISDYILFKDGIEDPLKLEDLFVPGFDYKYLLYKNNISSDCSFSVGEDSLFFRSRDGFASIPFKDIGCENLTIFE